MGFFSRRVEKASNTAISNSYLKLGNSRAIRAESQQLQKFNTVTMDYRYKNGVVADDIAFIKNGKLQVHKEIPKPYLCVSHVWSESIDNLDDLVGQVKAYSKKFPDHYVWLDLFAIPLNDERNYYIGMMGDIYHYADHTLIALGSGSATPNTVQRSRKRDIEIAMASEWNKRLWTLQEVLLNKNHYILHRSSGRVCIVTTDCTGYKDSIFSRHVTPKSMEYIDVLQISHSRNTTREGDFMRAVSGLLREDWMNRAVTPALFARINANTTNSEMCCVPKVQSTSDPISKLESDLMSDCGNIHYRLEALHGIRKYLTVRKIKNYNYLKTKYGLNILAQGQKFVWAVNLLGSTDMQDDRSLQYKLVVSTKTDLTAPIHSMALFSAGLSYLSTFKIFEVNMLGIVRSRDVDVVAMSKLKLRLRIKGIPSGNGWQDDEELSCQGCLAIKNNNSVVKEDMTNDILRQWHTVLDSLYDVDDAVADSYIKYVMSITVSKYQRANESLLPELVKATGIRDAYDKCFYLPDISEIVTLYKHAASLEYSEEKGCQVNQESGTRGCTRHLERHDTKSGLRGRGQPELVCDIESGVQDTDDVMHNSDFSADKNSDVLQAADGREDSSHFCPALGKNDRGAWRKAPRDHILTIASSVNYRLGIMSGRSIQEAVTNEEKRGPLQECGVLSGMASDPIVG
ncbi:hypothetical protein INT44_007050 [Umbelopsis vinacea]|uniref:Heterokaryon incompatibility domain-containing protein n=1 Tax=Umbelopsis vinacea TaxID=44442 RepID=A0A8H7U980_9FUNG|nr:hypothetical protein INT44_007050 [Umbelopsis vinacea]